MNSPTLRLSLRSRRRSSASTIEQHDNKTRILDQILSLDDEEDDDELEEMNPEVRLASILFALVGVGYLFPFSALTQPVDYWNLLFPDKNIEFPLTVIYMYTNLIMLGILVFGCGGVPAFTPRIVGGFVGQFIVLLFVPTSYFWGLTEYWNEIAVLGGTAVVAIVTAFLDSSVIALACQYPLACQEYLQLGIGISTLVGSIYRDVTKLLFPPDMTVESSLLYFYSGALTIALCILAYYKLMTLDLSKKSLAKAIEAEFEAHPRPTMDTLDYVMSETTQLLPQQTSTKPPKVVDKWDVLRKVWFNELMVCLLFMSTLALWPPLITEIPSFNFPGLVVSDWWPLILLTIFSIADCTGRLLVRFRMGLTPSNIWIPVALRMLLFPLIICSVKGIFFTNDVYSIFFVSLLGLTNGFVGTLSIILVNELIDDAEQPIAGTFTSFALNSGLVFGATIGMAMDYLVVRA